MSTEHFTQFFPAVCAGLGLFLVGIVNLLLLRHGPGVRIAATLLALGLTLGASSAIDHPGVSVGVLRIMAVCLIPCLILGSRHVAAGLTAVAVAVQRPGVRYGVLTVVGVATAVTSVAVFETEDRKASEQIAAEFAMLEGGSPSAVVAPGRAAARTDRGSLVVLREPVSAREGAELDAAEGKVLASAQLHSQTMRRGHAGDHTNCHGWVFTGGQFRLAPDTVQLILDENGYAEVDEPQPGDVVIYRANGGIAHSAVVRYVTDGQPVLVEGKWGALGIILHPVDKSVYGEDYAYYRSLRSGHVLVGLGGRAGTGELPAGVAE